MSLRIGINGFGRIGRTIFRLAQGDSQFEVVKINDLASTTELAHLLKYDSVHGNFNGTIEVQENAIVVNGKKVLVSKTSDVTKIDWRDASVDIVLECTGRLDGKEDCLNHIKGGAKKVIISAPGDCDYTVVMGVNEAGYDPQKHEVISNASCTTNCLAPVVKVLDEKLKVKRGFMTTVHSYTNDQRIIDGGHKDLRRARAGAINMIPTSTGGAKAIGLVLPRLKGKLDGMAIRVPTPNVSLVDFVADVETATTVEQLNGFFQEAAKGELKGILAYSSEPLVSTDYNGSRYSSVVDGLSTKVMDGTMVKVLAWYDNESGFSTRMIDLAKYIGRKL
ncbi:MAG: type I glyceraldehyde-3-phosphate dehydrogenase [Deltaproteobacteria bacterium]|nr:type I glyceraldehyde-3-phosphate dehydrogenase [Deltaproteobacteria bacterium]